MSFLVTADKNGNVAVVHDVVADAAHERATNCPQSAGARNNEGRTFLLRHFHYRVPWWPVHAPDLALHLQGK